MDSGCAGSTSTRETFFERGAPLARVALAACSAQSESRGTRAQRLRPPVEDTNRHVLTKLGDSDAAEAAG
eukprot:6189409-Pleurochrysis_carterae.AAC.3